MIFLDCSELSQEKSRVYRLREKGERKRKANKTFVFSCFIQLFSSFLFILKFIHFYLFSFFFFFLTASITQLKKKERKENENHQKWFHVVQSTWRTFLTASPGCHLTSVVQHWGSSPLNPRFTVSHRNLGKQHEWTEALPVRYFETQCK